MADTYKAVKTKFKPPKFMVVRWMDSATEKDAGWKDGDDQPVSPVTVWTCGWLIEETDEHLTLIQAITEDGGYGHDWAVPKPIKKRRIVKIVLP